MTASLSEVASALPGAERSGADVAVVDATHDSRQVDRGWLFCAIPGATADGHDHAPAAVAQGAAALLVERRLALEVPQILVPSVRAAAGPAAAVVHGRASERLTTVGITGTNGKTTTAYLLEAAFAAAARGTGVIGTVETRIHGETQPGVRTTPEGPDLQRLLRRMWDRGADAVVMEVSSHGLHLDRVAGTRFAVAAWTNLSQDHLDFHPSMEDYFAAKARLFTAAYAEQAVIHLDGPWGRRLRDVCELPARTFGRDEDAQVRIVDEAADVTGSRARLVGDGLDLAVSTRLPGRFNLTNAATAVLAAIAAGVAPEVAAAGVAACPGAPGRLERVDVGQPFTVLVDYAHTPDAVEQAVRTVRDLLAPGRRVLVVLGAGGDRDRGKREPMGAAAATADVAVLTSDNPRTEDPQAILDAVTAGARGAGTDAEIHPVLDRRAAIGLALDMASPGDVVLVAGKGHETGQEFADHTVAFDDRLVAAELLRETVS